MFRTSQKQNIIKVNNKKKVWQQRKNYDFNKRSKTIAAMVSLNDKTFHW